MNEQLQNAVATILERAITGIDSSVDFMQAELPEVIEQLLMWYAVSNVVYAIIGIIFIYAAYLMVKKPNKEDENWMWEWDERRGKHSGTCESIFGVFAIFPGGVGFFLLLNIMDSLKIWIAPKIWLMEYAASIVK